MRSLEVKRRIDMDLHRRSLTGIIVYALMLPAVFWPFDFHTLQPQESMVFALIMLAISLVRGLYWYKTESIYHYSPRLWLTGFTVLSLSHASVLSTFFFLSIYDIRFEPILHVTMLAIGGIASSALIALIPRIRLALLNLCFLLTPSIIGGLLIDDKLPYAGMIGVYVCFVGLMGVRASKEYKRSFKIETALADQKDILEKVNKIDALTNIYNRGHFNIEYDKHWFCNVPHKITTSLMLIDIDHFKKFNDIHGHLCGDACIVHVASLISKDVPRRTDIVARFGGEEFIVLLPNCDPEAAEKIAERIRHNIQNNPLEYENADHGVTVSIGVAAMVPDPSLDPKVLIEAADKAMYDAKSAGRNCVRTGNVPSA